MPFLVLLVTGRTLAWRDLASLNAPLRPLVSEALRAFRLPLWNPYEAGGQPLFAQAIHAVLSPISIAGAFLAPRSVDFLVVGHLALAAAGAYVASRVLGASRTGGVAAAFAYALSGYVLSSTSFLNLLAGAAAAPWVMAGLIAAAKRGWMGVTWGALAVCMGIFSGDLQTMAVILPLAVLLAWQIQGGRGALCALAAVGIGMMAAAVQLLPSWEAFADTARAAGLQRTSPEQWSLAPARMVELLLPGFFVGVPRDYTAPIFQALGGASKVPFPFFPSVFVGLPVLALACGAAVRNCTVRWLLVGGAVALWLALGPWAGGAQLTELLPLWREFRYSEKFVGIVTLCLALGAGAGVELLSVERGRWAQVALSGAGGLVAVALVALMGRTALAGWMASEGVIKAGPLLSSRIAGGAGEAAVAMLSLFVIARWVSPCRRATAVAVLLLAEGLVAARFGLHLGALSHTSLKVSQPLQAPMPAPEDDGTPIRIYTPLAVNTSEAGPGRDAVDRYLAYDTRTGIPPLNVLAGVDNVESNSGMKPLRAFVIQGSPPYRARLARRFAATHVVAPPPRGPRGEALLREATEGARKVAVSGDGLEIAQWELPHRPWAFFARGVTLASGVRGAALALGQGLDRGDESVVLEAALVPPVAPGRVLRVERAPERVRVEAEAEGEAVLVVNDAYARGWRAYVDGAEVPIWAADVLVRAVPWPKGRHLLEMRYRPDAVQFGEVLSLLGFGAIACCWGVGWRRRPVEGR